MMRRSTHMSIAILGLTVCCGAAFAETVTLSPSRDATLFEDPVSDLSNGGGQYLFIGRTLQETNRRALIAFDVSGIPAGSVITDVSFKLTVSRTISGNNPVTFHRMLADWSEGVVNTDGQEGSGADAQPGDSTWKWRSLGDQRWATDGGDFVATPSVTSSVAGNGPYTINATGFIADVQAWVNNPATNFGWILLGEENVSGSAKRFNSSETPTNGTGPSLIVTFTPPIISGCGTADFDGDGDSGTDADIEAFFACLAGNCCPTCFGADFDADGDTGTDADIEAFFRVLAGQPC